MFDVMGYALLVVGFVISQENLKDRATEFLEYLKRDRPSARAAFKEVLTSIPYLFRMELRTFPKVVGMVSVSLFAAILDPFFHSLLTVKC